MSAHLLEDQIAVLIDELNDLLAQERDPQRFSLETTSIVEHYATLHPYIGFTHLKEVVFFDPVIDADGTTDQNLVTVYEESCIRELEIKDPNVFKQWRDGNTLWLHYNV